MASILSGGEVPIITGTAVKGAVCCSYKQFGTLVNLLPMVRTNGKIQLEMQSEISALDEANSINVGGSWIPGFRTRNMQAAILLEDGQTLVIGGLKHLPAAAEGDGGGAKDARGTERELMILVTPHLAPALSDSQAI